MEGADDISRIRKIKHPELFVQCEIIIMKKITSENKKTTLIRPQLLGDYRIRFFFSPLSWFRNDIKIGIDHAPTKLLWLSKSVTNTRNVMSAPELDTRSTVCPLIYQSDSPAVSGGENLFGYHNYSEENRAHETLRKESRQINLRDCVCAFIIYFLSFKKKLKNLNKPLIWM